MRMRVLTTRGAVYEKFDHQLYTSADTRAAKGMEPIITPHNVAGAFSNLA